MPRPEDEIDRLYQLPLAEFVGARNALARRADSGAPDIRALPKPTLPAWAVNQLYWQRRAVYDELIERALDLRATHAATIRGRRTDLRGASRAHEEAVEAALKTTLELLAAKGQPITEPTRQAIATTLRSLPGDEPAGRLSRQLQPRGLEVLAGAIPGGRVRPAAPAPGQGRKVPTDQPQEPAARDAAREKEARLAAARDELAAAARATREAEQLVRREEFEAARANRDVEKADASVKSAEETLRQAEAELADARRAASAAKEARDLAQSRSAQAAAQLADARLQERRARAQLERLQIKRR